MQNNIGRHKGIHHPGVLRLACNVNRIKHRNPGLHQSVHHCLVQADIFPIGHGRGGKDLACGIEQPEKNLLFPGRLGLNHGQILGTYNSAPADDRTKISGLVHEFLVHLGHDDLGGKKIEQSKRHTGRDGKNACIPYGQTKGDAPEKTDAEKLRHLRPLTHNRPPGLCG